MRGHASIQGSTDIPTLYDLLPGYLPMPKAREGEYDLRDLRRLQRLREGLVGELRQVHRLAAEGLLRRRGDRGERLRLRPPAEDHRQPLALPDDAARLRRRARRAVRDGPEPGGRLPALRPAAARARAPEVARGARPLRARDRDVLARRARGPLRRAAPGGHPDRGVPDAGRLARREGRALHEHAAAAAVARQGDRAARRRALGAVVHAPPVQARPRALRGLGRPTATGRSSTSRGTTRSTARSASPTPRPCCRRSTATTSPAASPCPASASSRRTARRPRAAGSTPVATRTASTRRAAATRATSTARAAGSRPSGRGRGRPTAACSTTAPPPTREGKPWSERKKLRLVGRGRAGKWTGYDVPDFPPDKAPDYRPERRRQGDGRDRRHRPVHHDGRRQGLAVLARGPDGRADADPLRAARVAGREPALPRGRLQPGGADLEPARQPGPRRGRRALPVRRHDVPAHRAPHGGRDEPQPAVAGRAAAGDVRRDRPDPGRASAASRTAAGW